MKAITFPAPASDNFYRVTAVNAQGEGPYCGSFNPGAGVAATPCVLPGIQVINDTNADGSDNDPAQQTPPDPRVNVRQLYVAEPDLGAGVNKLVFTMQLACTP